MTTPKTTGPLHAHLASIGRNGGQAKSKAKSAAAARNIALRWAKKGAK